MEQVKVGGVEIDIPEEKRVGLHVQLVLLLLLVLVLLQSVVGALLVLFTVHAGMQFLSTRQWESNAGLRQAVGGWWWLWEMSIGSCAVVNSRAVLSLLTQRDRHRITKITRMQLRTRIRVLVVLAACLLL